MKIKKIKKTLGVLILILFFSQIKGSINDSIILKKTIYKLENIETLSCYVVSKYNIPYQTDTLIEKYAFRFKVSKTDTLIGFKIYKFWKREDFTRIIYYNNYNLKKIEVSDSTIIHYNLDKYPNEIYPVKRILESEDNYFGILKNLKEANEKQVKITCEKEKVNGLIANKISFVLKVGRNKNDKKIVIWIDTVNFLPIKYYTTTKSKLNGVESINFKECVFYSVKYNERIDDNQFTVTDYKNFKNKEYIPQGLPKLLEIGSIAPDWNLKTIRGKEIKLKDYRGKTLLIEFWAPDCGFSLMSIDTYKELKKEFNKKSIEFISVYFSKKENYIYPIIEKFKIDYSLLKGTEKIKKDYNAIAYPTTYIIGKNGKILFAQIGMLGFLKKKIIKVLNNLNN